MWTEQLASKRLKLTITVRLPLAINIFHKDDIKGEALRARYRSLQDVV